MLHGMLRKCAPVARKHHLGRVRSSRRDRTHHTTCPGWEPSSWWNWGFTALPELSLQELTLDLSSGFCGTQPPPPAPWAPSQHCSHLGESAWAQEALPLTGGRKMHTQPLPKTHRFYWAGGRARDTLIVIIMNSGMSVIINSFNRFMNHSQNRGKQWLKINLCSSNISQHTPEHWTAWTAHSYLLYTLAATAPELFSAIMSL